MDKADAELIESFLDGDEGAFNEIVERYKKRIYYAAYRMVKNHEDAMDISQEVFIRAYKSIRWFNKSSSLYTWLYRITINLSINHIKKESSYKRVGIDEVTLESTDRWSNPRDSFESAQLNGNINQAVDRLPIRQRTVFMMRIFDELRYEDISQVMGITVGAAKANYFHAVNKLREYLKDVIK
jgi:RNA polymerase sigma-70 factor (ECF subfamily)